MYIYFIMICPVAPSVNQDTKIDSIDRSICVLCTTNMLQEHVHVIFGCVSLTETDNWCSDYRFFRGYMSHAVAAPVCGILSRCVSDVPCISESFLWRMVWYGSVCVCESTSEDSPTYDIKAINHNRLKSNLGFTLEEITYLLRQLLAFHIDTLTAHAMHCVRTIFVCLMCVPRLICMFIRNSLRIKRIYRNIWFLVTSKWFPVIN